MERALDQVFLWLARFVLRMAAPIVVASLLLAGGALYYTYSHLGMDTDTADMISPDLPFRRTHRAYQQAFPQFNDTMLIVIDAASPEAADEAVEAIVEHLQSNQVLYHNCYSPEGGNEFFRSQGLLYLEPAEINELIDDLARAQPLLALLAQDPSIVQFADLISKVVDPDAAQSVASADALLEQTTQVFRSTLAGRPHTLSWQTLMMPDSADADDLRRFIIVQPQLDFTELFPAAAAIIDMRAFRNKLEAADQQGLQIRVTGSVALEYDEVRSASRGVLIASALAFILVSITLWVGLRTFRLIGASLYTLVVGIMLTAGFAAVSVGHLNMISIAFTVLYIGLGVDYSIHICFRYREMLYAGATSDEALVKTLRDVGSALLLCTGSTAIGFYSFIPTKFAGLSELGLIAGTGMFINLLANLIVLPAIIHLLPLDTAKIKRFDNSGPITRMLFWLPYRFHRLIRWGALVLGVVSLLLIGQLRFDYSPINLQNPASESVATIRQLMDEGSIDPWTISILVDDAAAAKDVARQAADLPVVERAIAIDDFVPKNQERKIEIVQEASLVLGPIPAMVDEPKPHTTEEEMAALRELRDALERAATQAQGDSDSASAVNDLHGATQDLLAALENGDTPVSSLDRIEQQLFEWLPASLTRLRQMLSAEVFTRDDLPDALVSRWISDDGSYRVEVFPEGDVTRNKVLRSFVNAARSVDPDATGDPVVYLEAGDTVVRAFVQAFIVALVAILIMLLIVMRSLRDSLLVMLPLVLGGLVTGALMVLLGLSFNFANVLALPLLLGLGVDSGIHIVQRARNEATDLDKLLQSSTAGAVLYSTVTTLYSFGNLAFSSHRGTASMGILLTIGMLTTLAMVLIVLPAFLYNAQASPRTQTATDE